MYLPTQTRIRLPKIKDGLRNGLNYTKIGASCGVTSQTIDRDMKAWVESGDFEVWLKTEFAELHGYARTANPMEAYKEISKLVGKMVTRKIEAKTEVTETVKKELTFNFNELPKVARRKLIEAEELLARTENSIREE
jgi:hypothetical protein